MLLFVVGCLVLCVDLMLCVCEFFVENGVVVEVVDVWVWFFEMIDGVGCELWMWVVLCEVVVFFDCFVME